VNRTNRQLDKQLLGAATGATNAAAGAAAEDRVEGQQRKFWRKSPTNP
jgi:hypothetical protein